jgi:hypothetical protein|tara:strand:+ start:81 stop:293 length:213 start_codon:yes stop_codon:yes gene_type:complete
VQWRYDLGDLVSFKVKRWTEEYHDFEIKIGVVTARSLRMTRDNVYKIKTEGKDYWVSRPRLTLLSKATKG